MDVVLALALTQLLFSSSALAIAAKSWAVLLVGENGGRPGLLPDPEVGALLEPCLCVPICCFPAARKHPEEQQEQQGREEELRKRLGELQRQLDEERGVRRFTDERRVEEERLRSEAEASLRTARLHLEESTERHRRILDEAREHHRSAIEEAEVRHKDSMTSSAAGDSRIEALERQLEEQTRRGRESEEARAHADGQALAIADALAQALNIANQTGNAEVLPTWMQSLGGPGGVTATAAASGAIAAYCGGEAGPRSRHGSDVTIASNAPSDLPLVPPGAQVIDV